MNENTDTMDQEFQEFDLEDILSEFSQNPEASDASEPEEPEISGEEPSEPDIEPMVILPPEEPEDDDAAWQMQTLRLSKEAEEDVPEPAFVQQEPEEEQMNAPTMRLHPEHEQPAQEQIPEEAEQADQQVPSEQPQNAHAGSAVDEEFIPSPSLFSKHSRLRQLKKKLVSGPEKEYYALSEKGVTKLQIAIVCCVVITILSAWAAFSYSSGAVPANRMKLLIFSQILCTMLSGLMGVQLMLDSIGDLFHGRVTINLMILLTFLACMADGVLCLQEQRVPCCAAFSLEMLMALCGRLQERNTALAQLDTMRKAVRLHGIVRTRNFYNGKDGLLRVEGEVEDFMEVYRKMSGPQIVQSMYCVLALIASGVIAALAAMRTGSSMGVQIFATSLLVAVPATFLVSISRPMAILQQRLHLVGAVLCGWRGVKGLKAKAYFPIYDLDLFPKGSTKLNGVKFYGDEDPADVVSYTASLMSQIGGSLDGVFRALQESRGGTSYPVHNFRRYADGGIGGSVEGNDILLGSMDFLQDMGIQIPEGTMVNQAVYAAINGRLSAVYAITYSKMRSSTAGLATLCNNRKMKPVLLCADFMINESFVGAKFNMKTRKMLFPDAEAAAQMRRVHPDAEAPVLALTTREELAGPAFAASGAKALNAAVKLGVMIHIVGGILGLVIMLALAVLGNTELLTASNILLYQLVWGIPGLLVTEWTRIL